MLRRTILQRSRQTELTKVGLYCVRELRKRALGQSDKLRGLEAGTRKVHLLVSGEKSVFLVRWPLTCQTLTNLVTSSRGESVNRSPQFPISSSATR